LLSSQTDRNGQRRYRDDYNDCSFHQVYRLAPIRPTSGSQIASHPS
jgi:hypothetical protein